MLVLITNRKLCEDDQFVKIVLSAIEAGVDWVILREKDCDTQTLVKWGKAFKQAMNPSQKLMVNGNIEAAMLCGADGVHLSMPRLRNLQKHPSGIQLGASVHSVEEAVEAQNMGADYLLAGHVYKTACKAGLAGRGTAFIQSVCACVTKPVIGLGGIHKNNASQVIKSGARGIAVMSRLMQSKDIKCDVDALKDCLIN